MRNIKRNGGKTIREIRFKCLMFEPEMRTVYHVFTYITFFDVIFNYTSLFNDAAAFQNMYLYILPF